MPSRPPGPQRGRRLAWVCASLVAAVLAVAAVASWRSLLETWYLHRLGSEDEDTRIEAATRLGDMGSLRAVPRLLALIGAEKRETYDYVALGSLPGKIHRFWFDEPVPSELPGISVSQKLRVNVTPLAHALYTIGVQADPLVEASEETAFVLEVVRAFWRHPELELGRTGYAY